MNERIKTTIVMPVDVHQVLVKLAAKLNVSVNSLIVLAVTKFAADSLKIFGTFATVSPEDRQEIFDLLERTLDAARTEL